MYPRLELGKQSVPVLAAPDWAHILKVVVPIVLIAEAGLAVSLLFAKATDIVDGLLDLGPLRYGTSRLFKTFVVGIVVGIGGGVWLGRAVYPGGYLLSTFLGPRRRARQPDELESSSASRAVILFSVDEYPGRRLLAFQERTPDGLVVASHVVDVTDTKLDRRCSRDHVIGTERWEQGELPQPRGARFAIGLPDAYRSGVDEKAIDRRLLPQPLPAPAQYLIHETERRVALHRVSAEYEFAGYTMHADIDAAERQIRFETGQ